MKTKHLFFIFILTNLIISYGQDISSSASTNTVEFTRPEGFVDGTKLADQTEWTTTSGYLWSQVIKNNGSDSEAGNENILIVKRQYLRSQINLPLQADSGEIITIEMIFRPDGDTANVFDNAGQLFAFGLKDSFDASDTQAATSVNGETISIEIDADDKLGIQYKSADVHKPYSYDYWNRLTIKFFVGNTLANSLIKAKLEHNIGSESMFTSGWINHVWDSQSLYNAVTGTTGAYMIFQSGPGLGTDPAATQLQIDKYALHTDDSGQLFLGGGFALAGSWSGNTVPDTTDRLFIFNKSPNLNNSNIDFDYEYLFIDSNSTLNVTKSKSVDIDDISLDGVLNILTFDNTSSSSSENNINVNNFTNNGTLNIDPASSLTVTGNLTNNGTVTLNSDADEFASIIVGGSSTGDIVYNRYVNTQGAGEWDLIGAPVDGLPINSFVTTNSSSLATSSSAYAIGVYDNSDDSWTNYTTSTVESAGNFDIGKGYQMATSSGATMAFTGTIATTDQTQSIINNSGSGGSRWNLVANPYPSYLNANTTAHATNNFLDENSGVIDDGVYHAVYGYNADGTGYTIYNNTSPATYIAPGQAFFVAAQSASAADLSFTEAMQTTTGGDDFIAFSVNTSSTFYLKLYEDQDFIADTKFYFDSNLTLGLDPGYDAGLLSQSTAIGSRLVEEDQGITMGINAMGIDSLEDATIPLVINRSAGVAFKVSLEGATIPQGVEVYLEDTQESTFTDLRAGDFTLNPQSELSGMGRFFLRLGSIALSVDKLEDFNISIYKQKAEKHITIEGLSNVKKASVKVYNLLGQELLSQDLEANVSTQKISTDGITTGVYVIDLSVNGNTITKKIIIN